MKKDKKKNDKTNVSPKSKIMKTTVEILTPPQEEKKAKN